MFESAGHVDFFPNGGVDQPSCAAMSYKLFTAIFHFATSNTNDLEEVSGCSHIAAYKFFTDSIENKNCQYNAYPCSSKAEFDKGNFLTYYYNMLLFTYCTIMDKLIKLILH